MTDSASTFNFTTIQHSLRHASTPPPSVCLSVCIDSIVVVTCVPTEIKMRYSTRFFFKSDVFSSLYLSSSVYYHLGILYQCMHVRLLYVLHYVQIVMASICMCTAVTAFFLLSATHQITIRRC